MQTFASAVFLVGPTAVGKSEVALLLAEELNAEIVSADSMQVYRGMDLGTAKPTAAERARVRHHLTDVVDVSEPFNVARYRALAVAAIEQIQRRNRLPLVVGGSGLYLRVLTEGLFEGPGANVAIRARLEPLSAAELFDHLQRVDPATAARIDRHNKRRLVRALEVFELTGKSISERHPQRAGQPQWSVMICLERDRADLYDRIERRVDWMFAHGLVEETQRLLAQGLCQNSTARAAAGYREVIEMLDGARGLEATIARVKTRTRQLARRQLTWFRHQARLERVKAEASATQTKERVRDLIENVRG
jgi:tRNA dimethylallyltransferase